MQYEDWKIKDLNAAWLDVGLSGKPEQVSPTSDTRSFANDPVY
jgi:hypothetical protein